MASSCDVKFTPVTGSPFTISYAGIGQSNTKNVTQNITGPKPHPLVPHVYALQRRTRRINPVHQRIYSKAGSGYRYCDANGDPTGLCALSATNMTALPSLAANAQLKALASMQGLDVNLATFFGEGHKTIEGFISAANRLAHAANQIRNKDFVGAFHTLGTQGTKASLNRLRKNGGRNGSGLATLSNGWLEYQYGWKPLISDLYGMVKSWQRGWVTQGHEFTIHGKESNSKTLPFSQAKPVFAIEDGVDPMFRGVGTASCIAKAAGKLRVSCTMTAELETLGLLNPLSLAWELLPYSFVIDWFIPIGNYLAATTATAGMTWVNGWYSNEEKRTMTVPVFNGLIVDQSITYSRSPWAGTVPSPLFLRLVDGISDSNARMASAASLLQQAFHRR